MSQFSSLPVRILLLSWLFCTPLSAQKTNEIDQLIGESQEVMLTNPVEARQKGQAALDQARQIEDQEKMSTSWRLVASADYILGDYAAALTGYQKALHSGEAAQNATEILKAYRGIINCQIVYNQDDSVTFYLDKAQTIAKQAKNDVEVLNLNITSGVYFLRRKKYENAHSFLQESLMQAHALNDTSSLLLIQFNLSTLYLETEVYNLAEKALKTGLELGEQHTDEYYQALFYNGLASLALERKNEAVAITNFKKARTLFARCNNIQGVIYANTGLLRLYYDQERYDEALHLSDSVYADAKALNDVTILAFYEIIHGLIQYKSNQFTLAKEHFEKAVIYAEASKNTSLLADAHFHLYEISKKRGDHKDALTHYEQYKTLNDSIKLLETKSKIEAFETQKELEISQKEKELQTEKLNKLEQERTLTRIKNYALFFILTLSILLLAVLLYNLMKRYKKQRMRAFEKEQLLQREQRATLNQLNQEKSEKRQLMDELNYKNNYIRDLAQRIRQKNEFLAKMSQSETLKKDPELSRHITQLMDSDIERQLFEHEIAQINASFHHKLRTHFPNLTENDLKIASLLKMGLSSKEIASLIAISSTSVDVSRSRLRKKLQLDRAENIVDFLNNL